MSLMDRDWYRKELAQRELAQRLPARSATPGRYRSSAVRAVPELRRKAKRRWLWVAVGIGVILPGVSAILPIAMTSHCDLRTWQAQPVPCWRYSWAALSKRVSGNMAASRGFPLIIVRTGR